MGRPALQTLSGQRIHECLLWTRSGSKVFTCSSWEPQEKYLWPWNGCEQQKHHENATWGSVSVNHLQGSERTQSRKHVRIFPVFICSPCFKAGGTQWKHNEWEVEVPRREMERKSSTSAAGQRRGLGETLNEVENWWFHWAWHIIKWSLFAGLKVTGEFLLLISTNVSSWIFHPGQ